MASETADFKTISVLEEIFCWESEVVELERQLSLHERHIHNLYEEVGMSSGGLEATEERSLSQLCERFGLSVNAGGVFVKR